MNILWGAQESLPIDDKSQQYSIRCQGIAFSNARVKSDTRPGVPPETSTEIVSRGIPLHITRCRHDVCRQRQIRVASPEFQNSRWASIANRRRTTLGTAGLRMRFVAEFVRT